MASTASYFSPIARLKPVRVDAAKRVIPKRSKTSTRWWRVNLGKRLTGTSKIRRYFETEKEAKDHIKDLVDAARERGRSAFAIPQALAVEAMALTEDLKPHGATLTDAVKFFLRQTKAAKGRTAKQLLPDYLKTKVDPEYRRDQGFSLGTFAAAFGERPIGSLVASEIDQWLRDKKWKPLNLRNRMRDYSMFFRWAKFHGHISENPFDRIARPKVPRVTPPIFTVEEVEKILQTAAEHRELELLPMMAICFFSGVRIVEAERMIWEMIDWKEGEIRLPGEITKTRNPRNIDIMDALRAWIGPNPPKNGPIVSPYRLRLRRNELLSLAGVMAKRNALRHSFASYHSAKYRDPGALQLLLGQSTPSVLFRHYIAATRRTDAEAYFSLRPVEENAPGTRKAA